MKLTKQTVNNLFFVVGVVACVVMLFTFDVSFVELWGHLCRAGWWLVPILGVWVLVYGINALSWRAVIGGVTGCGVCSLRRIFRLTVTGYALNYATPVGGLGGEPYRILELSRDVPRQQAASSVILYAMMHIAAHIFLWFTSVSLYLALAAYGQVPLTPAIGVALAVVAAFCLTAFYFFSRGYKHGLVVKTLRLIGRLPGLHGWAERQHAAHAEALTNIDRQIAALHTEARGAFVRAFALEYLSRLVQALEIMFMLLLFDIDNGGGLSGLALTYLHSVLILAITTAAANVIGFLPMQLGVQEGGFVLSIAALGLAPAIGIFVSIICRVREIVWIAVGLALMRIKS